MPVQRLPTFLGCVVLPTGDAETEEMERARAKIAVTVVYIFEERTRPMPMEDALLRHVSGTQSYIL